MKIRAIAIVSFLSFLNFSLADKLVGIDDSDLSMGQPTAKNVSENLSPDRIISIGERKDLKLELQFLYERNGSWVPVSGLPIEGTVTDLDGKVLLSCKSDRDWVIRLSNDKFKIVKSKKPYEVHFSAECGRIYELQFAESTNAGQAISVFETFERGRRMLENTVGLDFWDSNIRVVWPGRGDYYSWGTVNITNGHHWDVVAHEMGHAIYDLGNLGRFGGGPHKIDECYSKSLALSEGWASFFAAWLYIDLADTDAKFQYLVPRRAPIQIENVPEDVCRDTRNEWRVTAFFWDVIDLNRDSEDVEETFRLTWQALLNSNVSDVESARDRLESKGVDKNIIDRAWLNNF